MSSGVASVVAGDTHASLPLPLDKDKLSADLRTQLALKLFAFAVCYFLFGFMFLHLRLWNPQDWPLFMKRAAAGSTEYEIWPAGSAPAPYPGERKKTTWRNWCWGGRRQERNMTGEENNGATWLEMVDRTARGRNSTNGGEGSNKIGGDEGSAAVPKRIHYSTHSTGGLPAIDEEQGMRDSVQHIPTGATAASPSPPPIRKMRTSGLLLVGFTGFLLMLLWPIFFVWTVIWWTVYSFWAIHYIYISTRRPRVIAQAHSGVVAHLPPPNNAILVVTEITVTTEPRANRTLYQSESQESGSSTPSAVVFTEPYGYSATATAGDNTKILGATPSAETRTAGELNSFYPQVGKISRNIKTLLEYDSTMPAPKWCRAALLAAVRKRRNILDRSAGVGLPSHTPASGPDIGNSSSAVNDRRSEDSDGNVVSHKPLREPNNDTNEINSRHGITEISQSRIPTRRSSFRQHELIRQESRNGYGHGTKYDNGQIRREPKMTNSSHNWQRQRGFGDDEASDGVETRSLTPATLGKPRSSSASYDNKTSSYGNDGVVVSEKNVRLEVQKRRPIPSRLCESLSAAERNRHDHGSGLGPQRETTGQAVQVVIPRLRRAGDATIVHSDLPGTSSRSPRRRESTVCQPGRRKGVSLVGSGGNKGIVSSYGHGQVKTSSRYRVVRPPTPDRRSSIRDVRGLFTTQEGDHDHAEGDKADET